MKNQTILITGASQGIGCELAIQLAKDNVVIGLARDSKALMQLAEQYGIQPLVADLGNRSALPALLHTIEANWPDLSVLINNAGIQQRIDCLQPVDAMRIDTEIEVNLLSPLKLCCGLLPLLSRQSRSWVINITSVLAISPKQSTPFYNASKAALRSFNQVFRYQLRNTNINVIEVMPPITATALGEQGQSAHADTPQRVAAQILQGINGNKTELAIGKARLGLWLHRWLPSLFFKMMIKK